MRPDKFYNHRAGLVRGSCTGSATVFRQVLKRPELWIFLLLHAGVAYCWRTGLLRNWAEMSISFAETPWHNAGVVATLTALSQIAYLGRCYDNHVRIHDLTRQMSAALSDFAFKTRLFMRQAGHPHDQVACRFLIASMVLFMVEARGFSRARAVATEPGETFVFDDDWRRIQEKKLVKVDEIAFLRKLTCQQRFHFLLREVGRLANEALAKARAPPEAAEDCAATLLAFRHAQEQALETVRLPVPYGYFHLINLMVMINLFFWSLALGMTASYISPVLLLLAVVFSLSLLELSAVLTQPFGDNREELPAAEWVEEVVENVNALLDFQYRWGHNNWQQKLEEEKSSVVKLNLGRAKIDGYLTC